MNLKRTLAAVFVAASMIVGAIPAYAEGSENTVAGENAAAPENTAPALGSGAFSGGYSASVTKLEKGDSCTIITTTYIPITNFNDSVSEDYFNPDAIFGVASGNASFNPLTANSWTDELKIVGNFLCVNSTFIDVVYLGAGNTFDYYICYNGTNASISVPVSECVEYVEEEEQPQDEVPAAAFVLASGENYEIEAGESKTITLKLKAINNGVFSSVNASLTSSDGAVLVEETGVKTSGSSSPSFSFRISASPAASEGVYNLTLNTSVYNSKGVSTSGESYSIPVKVTSSVLSSGLSVSSYKISKKTVKPGDNFKLTLTLKNECNIDLSDVKVSLQGLDVTKFVLDGGFSTQSVDISSGKTAKVEFPLVACKGIANVRESIPVQVEYKINPANASSAQTLTTSVIAECEPEKQTSSEIKYSKYDISMTEYSFSSSSVKTGTKFTLDITLTNNSEKDIEGARVSLLELNGTKFAIDNGLTYKDFDIKAGKSLKFSFPLIGCDGISSIREVIPVEINFGTETSTVFTTVTCVPDKSKEDTTGENVFAPTIIIESYDFGGEYVTGGTAFPLKLTVKNTSAKATVQNLKVTISGGAGNGDNGIAFSPANSSNSFFIETLGIKETTEISLDLLPRADAKPDSYPVIVAFDYEYSVNGKIQPNKADVMETITIPLQQEDRFTINPPDFPETAGVGEMAFVSATFINKGKSGVYNVSVDLEGEGFDKSTGSYYIGNVASGSEEYYDVQITPYAEGEVKCELVVTYEDANGTQKEQRVPFTINVISYNYGGDFEMGGGEVMEEIPMEEAPQNDMTWLWFVIGGGVVVIVVVIIIIAVVKKNKKKRELEMDDEDI